MSDAGELVVQVRNAVLDYRGLRPLRVQQLDLRAGQSMALLGMDAASADVLVSLITGGALPDTGEVIVFGRATSSITDGAEWLRSLARFGLVGPKSVLVDQLTAYQNLAMPFSLDVDDLADSTRLEVRRLAEEVGIDAAELERLPALLSPLAQLRLRLGRALALRPGLLLVEHPTATLSATETPTFAADFARIVEQRGIASLVITTDKTFAAAVASDVLTHQPGTGAFTATSGWRRWFS